MRIAFLSLFLMAFACAQTPAPISPAAPPAIPNNASPPPAGLITPETVVAEIEGKKYTAGQVDTLLKMFPPQMQMQVRADVKRAIGYVLLMQYLADQALKANLQNESPLKETLEYQRMGALSQAELNQLRNIDLKVSSQEEEKFYKDHPEQFQEAKVKVIYVAFSSITPKDPNAKKPLTEAEAKSKIEDLKKQIEAGADFGKLAKENSDDKESAAKDGDFGLIKHESPYPEPIKKTVFDLKAGQVSEPLRQPNGFYLIRVEEVHTLDFVPVEPQIHEQLKGKVFNEYMQNLQKRFEVKVENPAYFAVKPGAPQTR
jgi:peptidyl-prolyl cis-trans isomerase C